ncbi:MAG: hypothetical protein R2748_08295 [Bryobacterales bacterium]
MGYAGGRCARFRPGAGDAVRFTIAGGALRWLIEADGLPVAAGELALDAVDAGAEPEGAPAAVAVQMRAYVAAYRASLEDVE